MVPEKLTFSPLSRRQIEADFSGGHIISDAGLPLLREVDKQHYLTQRLASVLSDPRNPELVRHQLETMTRQRVVGVAAGYEDLNDHEALCFDQALQPAMSVATAFPAVREQFVEGAALFKRGLPDGFRCGAILGP